MLPTHHLKTAVALALALSAIAPAAASAKEVGTNPFGETVTSTHPTPIVRVIAPHAGFDWADAGIGAAGGLALSLLAIGAALVLSTHRRTRRPAAPASRPTTEHTMPPVHDNPHHPNKPRTGSRSAAVAVGALVAIAVTALVLPLTGAHPTNPTNAAAHTRLASTHRTRPHHAPSTGCHAVLDPMTGQMHGGCPPEHTNTNPATR